MLQRKRASLSHLDERGNLKMVDVSEKSAGVRTAVATARVRTRAEVVRAITGRGLAKGDALAAARVAGILAAKKTGDWIPLCHPLALDCVEIDFVVEGQNALVIQATVKTTARTGVEMEAMVAASAAALTIYDMAKAADKGITIGPIQLEYKTGGKSGTYSRTDSGSDSRSKSRRRRR